MKLTGLRLPIGSDPTFDNVVPKGASLALLCRLTILFADSTARWCLMQSGSGCGTTGCATRLASPRGRASSTTAASPASTASCASTCRSRSRTRGTSRSCRLRSGRSSKRCASQSSGSLQLASHESHPQPPRHVRSYDAGPRINIWSTARNGAEPDSDPPVCDECLEERFAPRSRRSSAWPALLTCRVVPQPQDLLDGRAARREACRQRL